MHPELHRTFVTFLQRISKKLESLKAKSVRQLGFASGIASDLVETWPRCRLNAAISLHLAMIGRRPGAYALIQKVRHRPSISP